MNALLRPSSGASDDGAMMLVDDVELQNVTQVSERGGQQAPTKKTEKGFSYGTSVGPEPRSATFQAKIEPATYAQLADIRDADEPFPVTVGFVSLGACKLDDLKIDQQASTTSHYSVRISVTQIQEASTETVSLVIDATDGRGNGSTFSSGSGATDPTLARSTTKPVGDEVSNSASTVTDAVNGIAEAIGF